MLVVHDRENGTRKIQPLDRKLGTNNWISFSNLSEIMKVPLEDRLKLRFKEIFAVLALIPDRQSLSQNYL